METSSSMFQANLTLFEITEEGSSDAMQLNLHCTPFCNEHRDAKTLNSLSRVNDVCRPLEVFQC